VPLNSPGWVRAGRLGMASHLGELALGSAFSRSKSAILRGPGPKITTERSRACVFPRHERRHARFSVYTTRKAKARLCCVRTELSHSERHKSCAKSSLHLHKTMHGPSLSIRVGCITAGSEAVRACWHGSTACTNCRSRSPPHAKHRSCGPSLRPSLPQG